METRKKSVQDEKNEPADVEKKVEPAIKKKLFTPEHPRYKDFYVYRKENSAHFYGEAAADEKFGDLQGVPYKLTKARSTLTYLLSWCVRNLDRTLENPLIKLLTLNELVTLLNLHQHANTPFIQAGDMYIFDTPADRCTAIEAYDKNNKPENIFLPPGRTVLRSSRVTYHGVQDLSGKAITPGIAEALEEAEKMRILSTAQIKRDLERAEAEAEITAIRAKAWATREEIELRHLQLVYGQDEEGLKACYYAKNLKPPKINNYHIGDGRQFSLATGGNPGSLFHEAPRSADTSPDSLDNSSRGSWGAHMSSSSSGGEYPLSPQRPTSGTVRRPPPSPTSVSPEARTDTLLPPMSGFRNGHGQENPPPIGYARRSRGRGGH